jgi:hypothetical protein
MPLLRQQACRRQQEPVSQSASQPVSLQEPVSLATPTEPVDSPARVSQDGRHATRVPGWQTRHTCPRMADTPRVSQDGRHATRVPGWQTRHTCPRMADTPHVSQDGRHATRVPGWQTRHTCPRMADTPHVSQDGRHASTQVHADMQGRAGTHPWALRTSNRGCKYCPGEPSEFPAPVRGPGKEKPLILPVQTEVPAPAVRQVPLSCCSTLS